MCQSGQPRPNNDSSQFREKRRSGGRPPSHPLISPKSKWLFGSHRSPEGDGCHETLTSIKATSVESKWPHKFPLKCHYIRKTIGAPLVPVRGPEFSVRSAGSPSAAPRLSPKHRRRGDNGLLLTSQTWKFHVDHRGPGPMHVCSCLVSRHPILKSLLLIITA